MDPITQQAVLAAAGAAGGDPIYVDDVFSTFLYDGNGSNQTIVNGIDLAGEGGMVLQRRRNVHGYWFLNDTENGANNFLYTNFTNGLGVGTSGSSFNSNGFTIGAEGNLHASGNDVASWTFRKAPGFFDCVTYTGNGTAGRTVAHSLGSVPGMIIVKRTDSSNDWAVYHRNTTATHALKLNSNGGSFSNSSYWNNTTPTSSVFTLGDSAKVNGSGGTYVAYIFAHDDAQYGTDGNESIVKCGSFVNNGGQVTEENLGFEPQFIFIKNSSASENWHILDVNRDMSLRRVAKLFPNEADAEDPSGYPIVYPTATGFTVTTASAGDWVSGTYIYMAIRRPHKPPEVGTEVFAVDTRGGTSPTPPTYYSGFAVDWVLERTTGYSNWSARTRLIGANKEIDSNTTSAEFTNTNSRIEFDRSNGLGTDTSTSSTQYAWMFKRAAGFFDVVEYAGNGSGGGNTPNSINHNLSAPPEMIITRNRLNSGYLPLVYHSGASSINSVLVVSGNGGEQTVSGVWNNAAPTSTQFFLNLGENNYNGHSYIAYLFATLSGVSKVGSYAGSSGSNINVDCGFTGGARFILIKRRDSSGDWYVYDTKRGIVSGNDPYLFFNTAASQITNTDYIDPLSSGFTVTSSAPAALNASGGTYLFLAIA